MMRYTIYSIDIEGKTHEIAVIDAEKLNNVAGNGNYFYDEDGNLIFYAPANLMFIANIEDTENVEWSY